MGALTEISGVAGSGKTEAVLRFLAEHPSERVAWVERDFSIYPCALQEAGLERVTFADVGGDPKLALWTAQQVLTSQIFKIIVLALGFQGVCDLTVLRRMQLAAEKSQASVILLNETPLAGVTWPISLQLRASRSPEGLVLKVVKFRSGGLDNLGSKLGWKTESA